MRSNYLALLRQLERNLVALIKEGDEITRQRMRRSNKKPTLDEQNMLRRLAREIAEHERAVRKVRQLLWGY
jgi:hypothetical protein